MNYINLVNRFWQCDLEHHLTANDTRLYFFLVHTCNSLGWKIPFGHSDRHLAIELGASVNTIRECKNRLKQRGLIDFKVPQQKSKAYEGQTKYYLNAPTVSKIDTDTDTDGYTVPDTVADTDTDTNNKLNKTKQKNKYRANVKMLETENLRLVEEYGQEFVNRVYDYLSNYKKEKGYTSKDDNLTIRRWVIDAVTKKTPVISINHLGATGTTGRIYDPNDPKNKW